MPYMTYAQTCRWRRLRRTGWICLALAGALLLFFLPMVLGAGHFSTWVWLFSAAALVVLSVAGTAFTLAASLEAPPRPVSAWSRPRQRASVERLELRPASAREE
jgi:uncharacterized membrane protein YeiH